MNRPPQPIAVRLERYTLRQPNGCWEWQGSRLPQGYGILGIKKRNHYAHRVSWEQHHGPIPPGMCVLHRCDNPPCLNPAHLFLGTQGDNMRDMAKKGRAKAKLTEEQVRELRQRKGTRTIYEFAAEYGVSKSLIGYVLNGRVWAHVK
jgi:hypothetical protein